MRKVLPESRLTELDAAIDRGLSFLEKQQEADGSFVSFSSAKPSPFRRTRDWQTTFVPALMLASLAGIDTTLALRIRQRLADFLLSQRSENWSFNYWAKSASEYRSMPYPDDLDDTFCALAALRLHDSSLIDEIVLAKAVKLLLATETAIGGPYRTWLAPPDSEPVWLDIDLAVNSNIAYFLSLTGSRLPELDKLMGQAILNGAFKSPYYPFEYAFVYYLARAYEGPQQASLLRQARRLHRQTETDLDRALCLAARLRLGEKPGSLAAAAREIIQGQQRDGSWPAGAFYADPVKDGKIFYNGGAALTTAFVLEALQLYRQSCVKSDGHAVAAPAFDYAKLRKQVLSLAEEQCQPLGQELQKATLDSLRTVTEGSNGKEILGLVVQFNDSLGKPLQDPCSTFLPTVSLANLYGWLSYTIYDDFLDDEGQPRLLSVANVTLRRSLDCFRATVPGQTPFDKLITATFDTIDSANAWELSNCRWQRQGSMIDIGRFPDYGDLSKLAERSLGHSLTPLVVLLANGAKLNDAEFRRLREAFSHYLIARQLNDDCHDWQDDLENGRATYVVVKVLRDLDVRPGRYRLRSLVAKGQQQFWHETLPELCKEMHAQVNTSRDLLPGISTLEANNVISSLLDGIDRSIEKTLAQQSQAKNFLQQYQASADRP